MTAYGATDPLAATLVILARPDAALAVTSPGSASILPAPPDPSLARTSPESATRLPSWQF